MGKYIETYTFTISGFIVSKKNTLTIVFFLINVCFGVRKWKYVDTETLSQNNSIFFSSHTKMSFRDKKMSKTAYTSSKK